MRCGFCGYDLDPNEAESACKSCPLGQGCHLVRCPRCGYEMPPEARLVKWMRSLQRSLRRKTHSRTRQRSKDRSFVAAIGLDGKTSG
jgi:hypothetical protein